MIEDKEKKPYPYLKEATPEMVGDLAKRFEEHRQMTGSDGRYDEPKPKPKKKVMEPIKIPEIIPIPRYRSLSERLGHAPNKVLEEHYIKPPESGNTGPVTAGLSREFTQDKMREGKILKQLDRELANDARKNNQTANEGGDN